MNAIRRRRECCKCARRFTTFETIDLSLQVKKRAGIFQDFSEQKMIHGLDAACRHTRVSHEQIRSLAYKVKTDLMEQGVREISSKELGELVMQHLQKLDVVAYIRFACVYKRFKDVKELVEAIELIAPEGALKEPENEGAICATEEK